VTENQALALVGALTAARMWVARTKLSPDKRRVLAALGVAASLTALIKQS
jgi:H+/Cl- antiporter ClcA